MPNRAVKLWSKVDERFQNILGGSKAYIGKVPMRTYKVMEKQP